MTAFERILVGEPPDLVLFYEHDDWTLAAALSAVKAGVRIAHVESGLRSGDRTTSEEMNRILIDRLATLLFTHSEDADDHLSREGVRPERIRRVGPLPGDGEAAERITDHLGAECQADVACVGRAGARRARVG